MKRDKETLLEIGQKLFGEQGYHNTGTEEILEKADYPRSSFYHHFKNKEGFATKSVEFYGQAVKENMSAAFSSSQELSAKDRIKSYFLGLGDSVKTSNYESCCLVHRFSIDSNSSTKTIQDEAFNQFNGWVEALVPIMNQAQQNSEIRNDLSAREASEFLFSTVYGGFALGKLNRNPEEVKRKVNTALRLISN